MEDRIPALEPVNLTPETLPSRFVVRSRWQAKPELDKTPPRTDVLGEWISQPRFAVCGLPLGGRIGAPDAHLRI